MDPTSSLAKVVQWVAGTITSMNLLDVVTLAALVYSAIKVAHGRPGALLRRGRREALGAVEVSPDGVRRRVAALLGGLDPTPAQELSWLAHEMGLHDDQAVTFGDAERARRVAAAYRTYAARLDTGRLLGANHAPVVRADAERAWAVANLASRYGALGEATTGDATLEIPHRDATLSILGANASGCQPVLQAQDLIVSYRDSRLLARPPVPGTGGGTRRDRVMGMDPELQGRLDNYLASPRTFDGALPRLVSWAEQRDSLSGHRCLHLSLAETTYGCVVADHYPRHLREADGPVRAVEGERVRLLTLVLVCADKHLVFARRSRRAGSHRGLLGGTVNGNLEFDPRRGLTPDLDAFGLPDPRRALVREAREEMGITLDPATLAITGLGRFRVPEERGTNVLLTCAATALTRDDLLECLPMADPVEGAWELDTTLVTLAVPRTESELQGSIDWLIGSGEFSAHGTLAGLGALAVACRDDEIVGRAVRSAGLHGEVARPKGMVEESSPDGWRSRRRVMAGRCAWFRAAASR